MLGTAQCFEAIERGAAELGLEPADYVRVDSSVEEEGTLTISFYSSSDTFIATIGVPLEDAPE
ncbi:hypothetical protein CMI37_32985 [Candidatus Pacearchaeota archaeon]|nr:hypothetical protein [Candidatus Pacearchaeota archaeon]|tara:strand:- start:366 stop:554 length:189 start_codon:yes stop_codon:yes gene_type:complete